MTDWSRGGQRSRWGRPGNPLSGRIEVDYYGLFHPETLDEYVFRDAKSDVLEVTNSTGVKEKKVSQ